MRSQKHGLKALVLGIVVVLGVAVFAAGAQGQTHNELLSAHATHNASGGVLNPSPLANGGTLGDFLINLGEINLTVNIAASQVGTGVLLIAGRSVEVRCTGLALNSGTINNLIDASGEAVFTGCKKFDHKTLNELTSCVLKTLGTITAKFLALPVTHGGEAFILFEPQNAGEAFATISVKSGIGCILPLNSPVTGSVVALVDALDAVTQVIKFSPGIQLLVGDSLSVGGFPAYLTGEFTVEASAPHTGQKLGVH